MANLLTFLKMISLFNYDEDDLEKKYEEQRKHACRLYKIDSTKIYPSVTSITHLHVKDAIDKWLKYQPKDKCEQIRRSTSERGTRLHKHVEDYLRSNKQGYDSLLFESANDKKNFDKLRDKLDTIENIILQEEPLYSDKLRVAGTVDCIGE